MANSTPSTSPNRPSEPSLIADVTNTLAGKILGWPLAAGLGLLCVCQLLTWLPHYVTWPWWSDHDVWATAAHGWDVGILPYRDFHLTNFPGVVSLFWLLGRLFGWETTSWFYLFDSTLVIAFGLLLCAWSRLQFGRFLPGLVGYCLFLTYYLGLNYALAGQRDWHAPFFLVTALIVLQAWPGRGGWIVAAMSTAIAVSIRPQAVLLAPALLVALDHQVREPGDSWRPTVRAVLIFGLCIAAGLAILFFPLVQDGIFDDFLAAMGTLRPSGSYSNMSIGRFVRQAVADITAVKTLVLPVVLALVWSGATVRLRRLAIVWSVAYAGTFLYGLVSPVFHYYLLIPIMVLWSIIAAVLVAMVLEDRRIGSSIGLALVLLVLASGVSLKPRFSDVGRSVAALAALRGGELSSRPPIGYTTTVGTEYAAQYDWNDYRSLLDYVRQLPPTIRVANVLWHVPAITGPTGRLSAFPAESIAWLTVVSEDRDDLFAEALRNTPDSVVVWSPAEADRLRAHPLPRLLAVIERDYERDRVFGDIEVWRRRGP